MPQIGPHGPQSYPGATTAADADSLLTERQAAALLAVSVRTLQGWRCRGGGPRYSKLGRAVRYRRANLLAWIERNTVAHTSETTAAGAREPG